MTKIKFTAAQVAARGLPPRPLYFEYDERSGRLEDFSAWVERVIDEDKLRAIDSLQAEADARLSISH
jgi:hypothetical protein